MTSQPETTELALTFTNSPAVILVDQQQRSALFDQIKAELAAFVPDLTTATGRKAIASLAYKVTRTKTAIDAAGKLLNEDARKKIDAVDASRREIRAELDTLADQAREPLTKWEAAEEERAGKVNDWFTWLRDTRTIDPDATAAEITVRIASLVDSITSEIFQEQEEAARQQLADARESLSHALERARKAEADARELARLRLEQERREAAELARRHEEEAQAFARAEEKRLAEEAAEEAERQAEREKTLIREAAEEAARQADAKHAAELEAERQKHREAEENRLAEIRAETNKRLWLEAEQVKRDAEIQKTREEEFARQADRKHRGLIMKDVKEAIMSVSDPAIPEGVAKAIVLAIVAGEIPHVTLKF